MATDTLDPVVGPVPGGRGALDELQESLEVMVRAGYVPRLIDPDGHQLELPHSVFEALRTIVAGMAAGHTMTLIPTNRMLTTQQAADMLQVSRPHLVKLLNEGTIPFELVGSHRRINAQDVMDYRTARASSRRDALRELSQLSAQDPGGYR